MRNRAVCPPQPSSTLVATERDAAGPSTAKRLNTQPSSVKRRPQTSPRPQKSPVSQVPNQLPPQRRCWNCDAVKKKPKCSFPQNYGPSKYVAWPQGHEPPARGASKAEQEQWISHAEVAYPSTMKYRTANRFNHEGARTAPEVDG